ncbi:TonB-dependent receptor [Carboxylicivirga sp. A043]|uniref:SusC/RagA family TonB-linked outer membrane protein n=1 Tax=Carboxylicivirga litoralis TaxID=2816963 RepID=UPI0021CB476F|nr:TonB-dependent receptor [Carboxylicivirga sp. A043]MCU4157152.1 TonB-dependent receptor [Carboxylicivirga sp. A043]
MKKIIPIISLLLLFAQAAFAQKAVSGTVVDENGSAIPGVNVLIKGTMAGTITDVSGNYNLEVKDNNAILIFSFIGYQTKEEEVGKRSDIDIMMMPETELIDEVVAVGYNTVRKKDVTGAVAQVKASDLVKSPVTNYDQALAGRVAGVQVSSADGTPGEGLNIVIRGGNSITGDNSPLYVVDGIPMEDFDPASISSHDIKDFDVLKDASASAIYGSRGANGVILITTKNGKEDGTTEISLNSSMALQWIPGRLKVMSPYDYVKYIEEVMVPQGGSYEESFNTHWQDPELYTDEALASRGESPVSWQDEIMNQAWMQNHNLAIRSGNKTTNFSYSIDFVDQDGTLLNTGFNKINNNLKFNHRINRKAQMGGFVNYSYVKRTGLNISGNNRNSIIRDAITFRPVSPIVDDGREGGLDLDDPNDLRFNPVKTLENTDRYTRQDVVRGNLYLNYDIIKGLRLRLSGNYQIDNRKESLFYKKDTYQGTRSPDGINGTLTDRRNQTLSTSNTLTYKRTFNTEHKLTALGGFEAQKRDSEYFRARNKLMPLDDFGTDKIQVGTQPDIPESYAGGNTLISYFGSVNYGFREKYLLTVNYRADASSKFNKDNRWGYFPSAAVAWRLIEEGFINDLNVFSNLKMRAGWGVTGNNRIGDFDGYSRLNLDEYSGYTWNDTYSPGIYHENLAAQDLRWETTTQVNLGIDMGFINNRINTTVDYYKKNTTDLLLDADMAPSTGYPTVVQNVGEVQNEGVEFSINTVNINKRDFKWSSAFNISFNKNRTVALNSGQDALYTNPNWYFRFSEYQYITKIDEPVGMFYGLQRDGNYQMSDFNYDAASNEYVLKEGIPDNGRNVAPGSVKFIDQNGDGTINELDRVVIGNPHPKHFGGFTNDFQFKNFDLQVFLQWSYGNEILNANRVMFESPGLLGNDYNALAPAADRWTPENPSNGVHAFLFNGVHGVPQDGNLVSDYIVEDGSYIRLKTISFGYSFGPKMLSKLRLKKCRIYVAGQNLLTWTNYSGYDPEVSVGRYGALTPGLDYSAYPISATISGGIELKF